MLNNTYHGVLSTWTNGHTWIYVVLVAVFALAGCGPTAAVAGKLTKHTVTAAQLRAQWGEPCAIARTGPNEETWTYCVVLNDAGHEEWAQCRPDCEPAHRMRIVGGIIIDDMPAEVTP